VSRKNDGRNYVLQAAVEQDPQKLLELAKEINDLLEAKERRLGITPQ
jgi:hypothetical protein